MFKPKGVMFFSVIAVAISALFVHLYAAQDEGWRTIDFETCEVTAADVALSPDGQWLIFTMLGHLFRLPVEGGTAEQLTFGPYYDSDPVFSPDSTRVAFVSDRDGTEGNIFVLEWATGRITQVTHEPSTGRLKWNPGAGRPTWTPDGQAFVYLRFLREAGWYEVPALVRRVPLSGGEPETLSAAPRLFRSTVYLPDGRLAWMVLELETKTSRIEVMSPDGTVSTLRTLSGYADHVVVSPAGDGLYCDRRHPRSYSFRDLLFVPLSEGAEREIAPLSRRWIWDPQFAVAPDNKSIYLGGDGRLWRIALPGGASEHLAFRAGVRLEIQNPVPPPTWVPAAVGSSAPPRTIVHPRLSPDGRSLVFGAAGYLWQQALDGGQAQRLFAGGTLDREQAFSPDGRQLAFVHGEYGQEEVRVYDLESRQMRTLASGLSYWGLSWSPDGQRVVFVEFEGPGRRVVAVDFNDGRKEKLAETDRWVDARPQFSADGRSLYFSDGPSYGGTLYRLRLADKAEREAVTQLDRHLRHALVSPDGKWLAFRRNSEIWVAPLGKEPVTEEHIRQLSAEGGETFAFTPDGSEVMYAAGNRVWRHPLAGGEREPIPIRLELRRPTPPPVLVRRVRVLDFVEGGFSGETSLLIEQGRIRWMGSERDHEVPQETIIVDASGRFAIPGLFDMHVHAAGTGVTNHEAFMGYGVTSVREPGGGGLFAWQLALADRSEMTNAPVPRYFFAGPSLNGAWWPTGRVMLYDEHDARTYVRQWKERGAQFIKAYESLPRPLHRAVAEEARRLGLPVASHADDVERTTKNVTLGYASLEHIPNSDRLYDDVLQMLALAGTRWTPTLAIRKGNALLLRDEPERLEDAKFRAFTPEWRIRAARASGGTKGAWDKAVRGYWAEKLVSIRAAHRRGVRLLAGTDAPIRDAFPGASMHWELEHFVQAGIPLLEVLRIATQEGATAVGAEDHLGTLEIGKLADIVLLDANPLDHIKNTQTIWRVIKGGWVFDPDKLRPSASSGKTK